MSSPAPELAASTASDPYAVPATTPLSSGPHLERMGIRFGLVFSLPLWLLLAALLREALNGERLGLLVSLGAVSGAAILGLCVCGWWWAVRVRDANLPKFLLVGAVQGVLLTVMMISSATLLAVLTGNTRTVSPSAVEGISVIAPFVALWVTLMGALVRWRARVLVRRFARQARTEHGQGPFST